MNGSADGVLISLSVSLSLSFLTAFNFFLVLETFNVDSVMPVSQLVIIHVSGSLPPFFFPGALSDFRKKGEQFFG